MKDTHTRSVIKALTYRVTGSVATVAISWIFTRKIGIALTIGAGDLLVKIIIYYLHERLWDRIRLGKKSSKADYEI